MTRRLIVIAILLALPVASAHAAGIRGQLWLSDEAARYARTGRVPSAAAALQQREASDAVVYVETIPDKAEKKLVKPHWFFAKKPPMVRLVQSGRRFVPRILAVPAGARVQLENLDLVYHNAFSVSPAKRFDLGKYPPGRIDTLSFDRAGIINLHCDIHPEMVGFVVVVPNHEFTRPDSTGAFVLPGLPEGRYTMCAWHPRRGERRVAFEVLKRGDVNVAVRY